ncbi:MAG: hypothetical protein IPF58_13780 [Saprospirales bacterium]|nr:hypothetical protein [Saprospirales bacterium]
MVKEKITLQQATSKIIQHTKSNFSGIEIDLDAIENTLSSAITPSGFSANQVRQMLYQITQKNKIAYLHICEGVAESENGQTSSTIGKLISYLVSDFVKALD